MNSFHSPNISIDPNQIVKKNLLFISFRLNAFMFFFLNPQGLGPALSTLSDRGPGLGPALSKLVGEVV